MTRLDLRSSSGQMPVAAVVALAVALGTDVPRTPFVIWVGLGYLALLVAETRWTVRWLAVLGN